MKRVPLDFNIVITEEGIEIDVCVYYKCWITPEEFEYPMDVTGAVFKGHSLADFKEEHKKYYEKNYMKVEIIKVFINQEQYEKE